MPQIALIQSKFNQNFSEKVTNAAKSGAEIICLPELFHCDYFCIEENWDNFSKALTLESEPLTELKRLANELSVVLIAPYFEKRAEGVYHNSSVVFDADGSILGNYRKMHIPDDPYFYEKFYFTPGDPNPGYQVFNTSHGRIAVLICWDQWFPEAARAVALKGAEIIFYPTAIGWLAEEKSEFGEAQLNAWKTIQKSHAIANGVYVASCNRVGTEGPIEFFGNSFACDPFGQEVVSSGTSEKSLSFKADFSLLNKTRITWPFLRDRRIDTYSSLSRRLDD